MGGSESAISMGYGIAALIVLYLLYMVIQTVVKKIKNSYKKRIRKNDR